MDPELEAIVQRMIDAGEDEQNIAAVIQGYQPRSAASRGVEGFLRRIKDAAVGVKNLVTTDPRTTAANMWESQMQQFDKAGAAAAEGRYSEMLGHGAAGLFPVIGPAAASTGENLGTGTAEGVGSAVADLAMLSLPKVAGGARRLTNAVAGAVEKAPALVKATTGGSFPAAVVETTARGVRRATDKSIGGRIGDARTAFANRKLDRYAPNKANPNAGAVSAEADATVPPLASETERYAPNVSNPNAGAVYFDDFELPPGTEIDRYAPNIPASRRPIIDVDEPPSIRSLQSEIDDVVTHNDELPVRPTPRYGGLEDVPDNPVAKQLNADRMMYLNEYLDTLELKPGTPGRIEAIPNAGGPAEFQPLRYTGDDVLPDVVPGHLSYLDRQHQALIEGAQPASIGGVESLLRPKIRIPAEGVPTDAGMRVLMREAESGRGGHFGDAATHKRLDALDQRYRYLIDDPRK